MNTPMLDRLNAARVMMISGSAAQHERPLPARAFRFWDGCDGYFSADLTRDEVRQLAAELLELAR